MLADKSEFMLSKSVLRRLMQKGGVMRMQKNVYSEIRDACEKFVVQILAACVSLATQKKQKTINLNIFDMVCRIFGLNIAVGVNPSAATPSLQTGRVPPRKSKVNGPVRKFKQGTISAREVKFQQKKDQLVFHKQSFVKFCKRISRTSDLVQPLSSEVELETLRYSKSLIASLQVMCERYLVSLASSSLLIAETSLQKTVKAEHVQAAIKISRICGTYTHFL
jgi:histone H3/H4